MSAICTGRLYPRRNPWYSFSEAESTPGHMVLSVRATEKIPNDSDDPRTVRLVAQCLNHYAIPGPILRIIQNILVITSNINMWRLTAKF